MGASLLALAKSIYYKKSVVTARDIFHLDSLNKRQKCKLVNEDQSWTIQHK